MTFVRELEPQSLWGHFDRILEIPRGSREEDAVRDYVLEVAGRHGLEHERDGAGNIVVRKPATAGREAAPITILQSHLDMVNEKNADVEHDFATDPIRPERADEWLKAQGTTLGADNGIGVAAMLAIMEADDIDHGPLELLFTIDEESGLTGAGELDGSILRGRQLLNLDTEEENAVTVGCAGGGDSTITLPVARTAPPADAGAVVLTLKGLKGGHSGIDIDLQRGNAVALLVRILDAGARETTFHLADFRGGDKHNALPREARAAVVVAAGGVEDFRKRSQDEFSAISSAFAAADPDMELVVEEGEMPEAVLESASSWNALHLIHALPHGVASMSYDIPDLVETSNNVARAALEFETLEILTSTRSSVASELEALRARIRAIAHLAGAEMSAAAAYPGWKPNLDSHVLKVLQETFEEQRGKAPHVEAVHAGLETGIIGEKVPGMDMVSFGPQIESPHSPDERVHIESVGRFYRLLVGTLERLAKVEGGSQER